MVVSCPTPPPPLSALIHVRAPKEPWECDKPVERGERGVVGSLESVGSEGRPGSVGSLGRLPTLPKLLRLPSLPRFPLLPIPSPPGYSVSSTSPGSQLSPRSSGSPTPPPHTHTLPRPPWRQYGDGVTPHAILPRNCGYLLRNIVKILNFRFFFVQFLCRLSRTKSLHTTVYLCQILAKGGRLSVLRTIFLY